MSDSFLLLGQSKTGTTAQRLQVADDQARNIILLRIISQLIVKGPFQGGNEQPYATICTVKYGLSSAEVDVELLE